MLALASIGHDGSATQTLAVLQLTNFVVVKIGELVDVSCPILDVRPVVVVQNATHLLQVCHVRLSPRWAMVRVPAGRCVAPRALTSQPAGAAIATHSLLSATPCAGDTLAYEPHFDRSARAAMPLGGRVTLVIDAATWPHGQDVELSRRVNVFLMPQCFSRTIDKPYVIVALPHHGGIEGKTGITPLSGLPGPALRPNPGADSHPAPLQQPRDRI